MRAATLTVCVVGRRGAASPRSRFLCIDNQAALDALAKGPTSSEIGAVLVGVRWIFSARPPFQRAIEYVNQESNDSDEPSRGGIARASAEFLLREGEIQGASRQIPNRGTHFASTQPDYELNYTTFRTPIFIEKKNGAPRNVLFIEGSCFLNFTGAGLPTSNAGWFNRIILGRYARFLTDARWFPRDAHS